MIVRLNESGSVAYVDSDEVAEANIETAKWLAELASPIPEEPDRDT